MSHEFPKKVKGAHCPYCVCPRSRSVSRYRPRAGLTVVYARCANPQCGAKLHFEVRLVYAEKESSPSVG
jgi:hypothetical protein